MQNDTTMSISDKHIESKTATGPKTVYQLSDKQPFVHSSGFSSEEYGEFFINCAEKANMPVGDVKLITQIYKDTLQFINENIPELITQQFQASEERVDDKIKNQIKLLTGIKEDKIKYFMRTCSTIRDDITRSGLVWEPIKVVNQWSEDWQYYDTIQVGDLYKILLTSEWISLLIAKNYFLTSYMQGLSKQAAALIKLCLNIEEAFVLLFWFRYKENDPIYENIFAIMSPHPKTGMDPQIWHSWIVLQMLIKKHYKIFADYNKINKKEDIQININFSLMCWPAITSILRLDDVVPGNATSFNDALKRTYFTTIFTYGSAGVLIFMYALYNKVLKTGPPNFMYTSNDQGDLTTTLQDVKFTNILTPDILETTTLDAVEIYKAKEYFDKNKNKIGKLYKSKLPTPGGRLLENMCPNFDVPKGPNLLGKIMGGGKRRKKIKKKWIKIKKNITLKKY